MGIIIVSAFIALVTSIIALSVGVSGFGVIITFIGSLLISTLIIGSAQQS